MRTVAIIQARMGSTRLPGKALVDVAGRSMLARVVFRTRGARCLDEIIVATTCKEEDDRIAEECARLGTRVYRGSEDDVLDRFKRAAELSRGEAVVRITADCPLLDPEIIDRVVDAFAGARVDYASTTLERRLPRGLDAEVFSVSALERAWAEAREPYQRVHVTPYFYENPGSFALLPVVLPAPKGAADLRWTVDTRDDLALIETLYALLGDECGFGWREVLALIEARPSLKEINANVQQKLLVEG